MQNNRLIKSRKISGELVYCRRQLDRHSPIVNWERNGASDKLATHNSTISNKQIGGRGVRQYNVYFYPKVFILFINIIYFCPALSNIMCYNPMILGVYLGVFLFRLDRHGNS